MGRKKTRAKELARRWRKKKHLRQKFAAHRNKAEQAERIFRSLSEKPKLPGNLPLGANIVSNWNPVTPSGSW